ncbi:NDP-sugar synthase [Streptomyces sp. NPDC060184]|uniref:nucleotidyltransferase family protein n=1 Tax=Streptomyces sp. NPDC060184 TaxID=3347064 RepID=UPI003650E47E
MTVPETAPTTKSLPVMLLCGGLGLRQRTNTDDTPKPLRALPDGRALLLHVLDYYQASGRDEFVLCVGYGADAIRQVLLADYGVRPQDVETGANWHRFTTDRARITLVDSGPHAEKSKRMLDARPHIGGRPFFLGYADVLSDFDLGALVTLYEGTDATVVLAATRVRSRYGELTAGADDLVTSFAEKPLRPELVSAGYFLCAPELLAELADSEVPPEFEDDVLPKLVARSRVRAVVHQGLWLPFDTYKDFTEAESLIAREGRPWLTAV